MAKFSQIGPAFLVTAAFIGPGTVITATKAGANFGFTFIWVLLFATLATLILQEMAARLGVVTQQGLGENIRTTLKNPIIRFIAIALVVCAIVIGNGAYQGGNISGASLGLSGLLGKLKLTDSISIWPILIGALAFLLLWSGSYKLVEKVLIGLVSIMSLAFVITFVLTKPDIAKLFAGFIPSIPSGETLTVIALIGTTIVPYNLFLHSASAKQKWASPEHLPQACKDLMISIPLGGLISMAILATAANAFFGQQMELKSAADIAPALQPLFGNMAKNFIAIGLFAAGISSAITAPLAAAYALCGILNLNPSLKSPTFKLIWIFILIIGIGLSSLGLKPVSIILFAQITNGILLPIVTLFLLWIMNTQQLAQYRNNQWQNILGFIVFLVTLLLSGRSLMSAFGML